jgi:hypothetical protein
VALKRATHARLGGGKERLAGQARVALVGRAAENLTLLKIQLLKMTNDVSLPENIFLISNSPRFYVLAERAATEATRPPSSNAR